MINKAFSRIINDKNNKGKNNKDKNKDNKIEEDELETDLNKLKENNIEEGIKDDEEIKNKVKPNDFLEMTMKLLNN